MGFFLERRGRVRSHSAPVHQLSWVFIFQKCQMAIFPIHCFLQDAIFVGILCH